MLSMALTRFLDSLERHAVSSKLDKAPPNSQTESLIDGDDHMNDHHCDPGSDWRDGGLGAGSRSDVGGSFNGGNVALTERALREHAAAAAGGAGAGSRAEHLQGKDAAAGGGFDDQRHGAHL